MLAVRHDYFDAAAADAAFDGCRRRQPYAPLDDAISPPMLPPLSLLMLLRRSRHFQRCRCRFSFDDDCCRRCCRFASIFFFFR